MTALFLHLLWRRRRTLLAWGLGLLFLVAATVGFYPSVRAQAAEFQKVIDQAPSGLMAAFGITDRIDIASPAGYLSGRLFGFIAPLCFTIVAVGVGAGIVAGDEEEGRLDLLLAHPLRRARWVAAGFGLLTITLAALGSFLALCIIVLRGPTQLAVGWQGVAAASLGAAGVAWVLGALALAVGAGTGRRAMALGSAVAVGVATYLLDSLSPVVDTLAPLRFLSPFWWAGGRQPVVTGFSSPWLLLLPAAAVALAGAAAWAFDRRDLGTAA